jgi:hypothetical protein
VQPGGLLVDRVSAGVGRDEDTVVVKVHQTTVADHGDVLT